MRHLRTTNTFRHQYLTLYNKYTTYGQSPKREPSREDASEANIGFHQHSAKKKQHGTNHISRHTDE